MRAGLQSEHATLCRNVLLFTTFDCGYPARIMKVGLLALALLPACASLDGPHPIVDQADARPTSALPDGQPSPDAKIVAHPDAGTTAPPDAAPAATPDAGGGIA